MPATVIEVGNQNVFSVISRDDFRTGMYAALDEGQERGRITPFQNFVARRRLRHPRRFEHAYKQALRDVPQNVYGEGFDFEAFLNWLVENLPAILELLMSLLAFI